jgi:putative ABC transport system permease protein
MLLAALAGLVLLGAGGAIYTGAYLNKVQLSDSLRSRNTKVRGLRFIPRLMLGFQCFISIGMLIAAISVYRQVSFFRSTPLGFNPTNVMVVELPQNAADSLEQLRARENAVYLRQTLDRDPDVQMTSLCGATALPGSDADIDVMDYTERHKKVQKVVYHIDVDANYFPLLQIPLLQGEPFRNNSPTPRPALATTAFINKAGWDKPIGETFVLDGKRSRVVGILPDFHFGSLHHALQPLMVFQQTKAADDMLVRVNTTKTAAVLRRLQANWKKIYPELPFYYSFLDEHLLQQYRDEFNLLSLLLTLTLLMIVISCIGLVAYVSFLLRMARADIAIRRVIGASFGNIYALYIRQFTGLLVIGFLVAAPLAWWLANSWLRQFAYHVSPRPVDAVIGLAIMGGLVGLIVLRYSWGSVRVNPARILRED